MSVVAPLLVNAARCRAGVLVVLGLIALHGWSECGTLEVNGRSYSWDVVGRFVMPGETLHLVVPGGGAGWAASDGELCGAGPDRADWIAPAEAGLCPITVTGRDGVTLVNAFVMVPIDSVKDGILNGYEIGRYPDTSHFPDFDVPRGFIEVTPENIDTPLSPRHTLREFVSRQSWDWPRYLVLRENLVYKLELLTDIVVAKGHPCERLTVFSGFRTPAVQNRRGSPHSAHIYGGAADLYVDADSNGIMDDLNGDSCVSLADARLLAGYVDELEQAHPELVGGCGWYRGSRHLGPFIQTDVRGERTRWPR